MPISPVRLSTVQTLRGLAAVIVAWSHLAGTDRKLGVFEFTNLDGGLGVQMFFVISGFILPYSLWKAGYLRSDYGRFILKRITRLEPPYFVSIAVGLAAAYLATLSTLYRGVPFSVTGLQLALHVGYLNPFFGKPWLSSVYWTLAIEFQFYLILGLAFPVLRSGNRLRFGAFVALCAVSHILFFKVAFLPFHWPVFLIGIVVFRYKALIISPLEAVTWIMIFSCWEAWVANKYEPGWGLAVAYAAAGAITALGIMYLEYGNKTTNFFANISYSLYLVHQPIGPRIVNLGARYAKNSFSMLLIAIFGMLVSIGCAYVMYRLIEKPAQRLAGKIRYRRTANVLASSATVELAVP